MLKEILSRIQEERRCLSAARLSELLQTPIPSSELAPWCVFEESKYARNLILRNEWLEVLCLCWRPGQMSPAHDHGLSNGVMQVIQGFAVETVYDLPRASTKRNDRAPLLLPRGSSILSAGQTASEENGVIHRVGNPADSGTDLISIHVYSPPLSDFRKFDVPARTDRVIQGFSNSDHRLNRRSISA